MTKHYALSVCQTVPLGHDHSETPFRIGDRVTYRGAVGTVYCARQYPWSQGGSYQRIAVTFDRQPVNALGERITHAEGASKQFAAAVRS